MFLSVPLSVCLSSLLVTLLNLYIKIFDLLKMTKSSYIYVRIYNEGDAVPEVAKLAGLLHSGVPIQVHVQESAKTLYHKNCIGEILSTFEAAAPHILFTWGCLTYCLPGGIGVKEHHDFQIDLV